MPSCRTGQVGLGRSYVGDLLVLKSMCEAKMLKSAPRWRLTEDSWVAVIGIGVPMTALRRGAYKCLLRYSFWVMLRT